MKKQRILSLLLALAMVFSLLPANAIAANAENFTDVSKDDWYYKYVDFVAEEEYFAGTSSSTFSPEMSMTRAMFVTVLAAVEGVKVDNNVSPFADVPANTWYSGAVKWAAEKGVVAGVGNNNFAPETPISREQMAVMMEAYVKWHSDLTGATHKEKSKVDSFKDADQISDWAVKSVEKCRNWGLIAGLPDGGFYPQNTASRAEVATVIYNLAWLLGGGGGGSSSSSGGGNYVTYKVKFPGTTEWVTYPTLTSQYKVSNSTHTIISDVPAASSEYARWVFVSWNTAQDGSGVNYDNDDNTTDILNVVTGITGDITLYAQWKDTKYDVNYYRNYEGDTAETPAVYTEEVAIGTEHTVLAPDGFTPPLTAPDNHYFDGWKDADDGAVLVGSTVNEATDLYANWSPYYTVTYWANYPDGSDTSALDVQENVKGSDLINLETDAPTVSFTDYAFQGWSFTEDGETVPSFKIENLKGIVDENNNVNLYAVWGEDFVVNYWFSDPATDAGAYDTFFTGEVSEEFTHTIIEDIPTVGDQGYTFTKWTTNPDGTGDEYVFGNTMTGITRTMNLYSQWVPNVRYWVDDPADHGNYNTPASKVDPVLDDPYSIITYVPVAPEGYSFDKWTTTELSVEDEIGYDGNKEDDTYVSQMTGITAPVDLYSKWNYHVELWNGEQSWLFKIPVGTECILDELVIEGLEGPAGYYLTGWTDAEGNPITSVTGPFVLYASWELIPVNTYTVTYYNNFPGQDQSTFMTFTPEVGKSHTLIADSPEAPNGYTFDGWYTEAECTTPAPASVSVAAEFYAKWNEIEYVDYIYNALADAVADIQQDIKDNADVSYIPTGGDAYWKDAYVKVTGVELGDPNEIGDEKHPITISATADIGYDAIKSIVKYSAQSAVKLAGGLVAIIGDVDSNDVAAVKAELVEFINEVVDVLENKMGTDITLSKESIADIAEYVYAACKSNASDAYDYGTSYVKSLRKHFVDKDGMTGYVTGDVTISVGGYEVVINVDKYSASLTPLSGDEKVIAIATDIAQKALAELTKDDAEAVYNIVKYAATTAVGATAVVVSNFVDAEALAGKIIVALENKLGIDLNREYVADLATEIYNYCESKVPAIRDDAEAVKDILNANRERVTAVAYIAAGMAKEMYGSLKTYTGRYYDLNDIKLSTTVNVLFSNKYHCGDETDYAQHTNEYPYLYPITFTMQMDNLDSTTSIGDNIQYQYDNGHLVNIKVTEKAKDAYTNLILAAKDKILSIDAIEDQLNEIVENAGLDADTVYNKAYGTVGVKLQQALVKLDMDENWADRVVKAKLNDWVNTNVTDPITKSPLIDLYMTGSSDGNQALYELVDIVAHQAIAFLKTYEVAGMSMTAYDLLALGIVDDDTPSTLEKFLYEELAVEFASLREKLDALKATGLSEYVYASILDDILGTSFTTEAESEMHKVIDSKLLEIANDAISAKVNAEQLAKLQKLQKLLVLTDIDSFKDIELSALAPLLTNEYVQKVIEKYDENIVSRYTALIRLIPDEVSLILPNGAVVNENTLAGVRDAETFGEACQAVAELLKKFGNLSLSDFGTTQTFTVQYDTKKVTFGLQIEIAD